MFVLETSGGVNNVCAPWGQEGHRQNLCKPALCSLEEEVMATLWRELRVPSKRVTANIWDPVEVLAAPHSNC